MIQRRARCQSFQELGLDGGLFAEQQEIEPTVLFSNGLLQKLKVEKDQQQQDYDGVGIEWQKKDGQKRQKIQLNSLNDRQFQKQCEKAQKQLQKRKDMIIERVHNDMKQNVMNQSDIDHNRQFCYQQNYLEQSSKDELSFLENKQQKLKVKTGCKIVKNKNKSQNKNQNKRTSQNKKNSAQKVKVKKDISNKENQNSNQKIVKQQSLQNREYQVGNQKSAGLKVKMRMRKAETIDLISTPSIMSQNIALSQNIGANKEVVNDDDFTPDVGKIKLTFKQVEDYLEQNQYYRHKKQIQSQMDQLKQQKQSKDVQRKSQQLLQIQQNTQKKINVEKEFNNFKMHENYHTRLFIKKMKSKEEQKQQQRYQGQREQMGIFEERQNQQNRILDLESNSGMDYSNTISDCEYDSQYDQC